LDRVSGIGQGKINKLKGKVSWWALLRLHFLPQTKTSNFPSTSPILTVREYYRKELQTVR
jgi:hypothetical protein